MKRIKNVCAVVLLIISLPAFSQRKTGIISPDGRIKFTFALTDSLPQYSVAFKKHTIIRPSALSLSFEKDGDFGKGIKITKVIFRKGTDDYSLVAGKAKKVRDQYNEATIPLQETSGGRRLVNLVVRVFNDGIAFRYEIPRQGSWSFYALTAENTTFHLAGDPQVLTAFLPGFTTPHEARHEMMPFSAIKADTLMDMPTLVVFPDSIYMAITEAELVDYAGMYLVKRDGVLRSVLSPLPGQEKIKVRAQLPHRSPWRVMLIGDRVGSLIESNIITSLNEPCKIADVSWIRPGTTDFHWWNGDIMPDTTFAPGINFEFNKYYIDFCARNHITYHSVIGYGGFAWYKSDAANYGVVGPHTNVTQAVSSLDMRQVCDYARKKGVGIRVWVNWKAIYPNLDRSFAQFQQWGIQGMMVDFLNRDDQEMVNIQTRILQAAAKYHLHIQFHGAYKPTGLSRTYPNEFTREGTLNYENDKWGNIITPDDDISIPFTRGLAGSTDYHLGGFRAVPIPKYKIQYTRPLVVGTRCHMLAMYIVLQSSLQMICDYPDAYEGQAGFDFLQEVPTVWDETKVLDAEVDHYITIARRKNNDWYVGTITDHHPRTLRLALDFLPAGKYTAEVYSDGPDAADNPNHLTKRLITVTNKDTIPCHLAGGGGQVIRLQRQD